MQGETKRTDVSVMNWMGTLFLASIPGVNVILWIVWAIFSKHRSKRNYAVAMLVLMVLGLLAGIAALVLFGPQISDWLATVNTSILPQ